MSMLKKVVFPAPLGPIRARISPFGMREIHVPDRAHAAEGLGEPARLEHRHAPQDRAHERRPASMPAMPRGKASTSTRRIAPSTICQ